MLLVLCGLGGGWLVCLCVVLVLVCFLCACVWLVVLYRVGCLFARGLVVWVVWVVVCCVDLVGYDFGWLACCWLVLFDCEVVGFRSVSVCGPVVSFRVCCLLVFVGFDW